MYHFLYVPLWRLRSLVRAPWAINAIHTHRPGPRTTSAEPADILHVSVLFDWPALSDGRTGEGVFGRFLMVLVVFGSF